MRRLAHLQMLRGVAASLVVVDHSLDALATRGAVGPDVQQVAYFLGWAGVATFLVISGLIMIRTAGDRFGQPGAALDFAWRRIIRIVPLYWAATGIYIILKSVLGSRYPLEDVMRSLLFWPYAHPGDLVMRPIVGQGWTLNLEIFFYAIFAVCLTLPRRWGLPLILAALPGLVLAGLAVRPLVPYVDPLTPVAFWTDPIILFFAFGVALGLIEQAAPASVKTRRPLAMALSALGLIVAAFIELDLKFPLQIVWQLSLGLGCVIAVAATTLTDRDAASMSQHILIRTGDASFSTYLFHPIVITALTLLPLAALPPWLYISGFIAGALVGGNVLGHLVYRFVERPMTEGLRRRMARTSLDTV